MYSVVCFDSDEWVSTQSSSLGSLGASVASLSSAIHQFVSSQQQDSEDNASALMASALNSLSFSRDYQVRAYNCKKKALKL